MLWALLSAFLVRLPAWMRAVVLGSCVGLFAAAKAHLREPLIASALVLTVAVITGGAFYLALRAPTGVADAPAWVALVGTGGLEIAVLAIVPIVRLAPPAIVPATSDARWPA